MKISSAPVHFSSEEIEQDRLARLATAAEDRELTPEQLIADFAPGTLGCHEALHTASIVMNLVDERLCEHPAILANPDWYRLASDAHTALFNLYQAIGARHVGDENGKVPDVRLRQST